MKDWLDLNRREFLAALGAAYGATAASWAAPQSWFLEYAPGEGSDPRERFVNTLCPMCPGGCGLSVRVVHGCAVGVRGNKDHPVNRGGLCSRASAVLQDLYNPDRLQRPVRSVGERGSGSWEPIEWDAAYDLIAKRLQAVRAKAPERVCAVMGRDRGLTHRAWRRFMRAFGSPNLIDAFPDDNLGVQPAVLATHGVRHRLGYDISHAEFVLSFSSGWLDAHWSTEQAARGFADFRRSRVGFRPKWVHVGPRFSLTAAKADQWLPIRPGTEGAVALGVAHIMLREGLYDRTFVERHGYGFDDWVDRDGTEHLGFRRWVLQEYTPGRVQTMTGLPEGDLFRLAREFSSRRPAVALGYDGGGCGAQAVYHRMAIHSLNALVGSIDVPGGVTVFQALSLLDGELRIDTTAAKGLTAAPLDGPLSRRRLGGSAVDLLAGALESGRPYPTELLFLVNADPVFSLAQGKRFGAALSGIPFVVACSSYHDDSNRYADLILPLTHGLQRWDFDTAHTLTGHAVVSISQPVIDSPPACRDPYEIVRSIAARLGGAVAGALPWPNGEKAVDAVCRELFAAGKGAPFGPANEETWAHMLESRGWRAPFAKRIEEFQHDVLRGGGWTDPTYYHREWDRVFRSPPGRFAFSSAYLARTFEALPDEDGASNSDRRCLPDCQAEERAQDVRRPLELYVYALPNLVGVSSPNLPWLNDIAGAYMFEKWRTWLEVHPETARRYGISPQDRVEVRTSRGRLVLPVKIYSGLMPGVIAIPFGFGRSSGGRWCSGIGENPADLVEERLDPLTGQSLWTSTKASIQKV